MKRRTTQLNLLQTWIAQRASLGRSGIHFVTLGLAIISVWMMASFVGQVVIGAQMERRKDDLRTNITQLEAENVVLATAVAYANSPAYAEQTARDQFGYAKDGDVVIWPNIVQATPITFLPTPAAVAQPTPEENWRGWAQAFFPPASH